MSRRVSTASETFAAEIRTVLLALGLADHDPRDRQRLGRSDQLQVRLRNLDHAIAFDEQVGFLGEPQERACSPELEPAQTGNRDRIHLPARACGTSSSRSGTSGAASVRQRRCAGPAECPGRLAQLRSMRRRSTHGSRTRSDYLFEPVAENADGGVQPTFDLSVPENVTYVARGFVSHNTIGLMMDCDTTGIEPDLALVKFKKLVGGGSMQIVNQTVPRALAQPRLPAEQVEAIVEYVAEHGHVVDAPGLRREHYEVFDCAMGERSIAPMGHVRMMAAVQPFLSGAISKTVNMPEAATVEDVEKIYLEGWKLGLKALAIYRDNCKVGQPLSAGKTAKAGYRRRPRRRSGSSSTARCASGCRRSGRAETVSFTVGGAEGYLTAGSYPDDGLGEIFVKLGKQGSTLAGVMDAFSMSISVGLQYGIPLEFYVSKFSNLRFEPAGMTDDPDIRIATSVMDYLFRRLALDYLPYEKRAAAGHLLGRGAHRAGRPRADEAAEVDLDGMAASAPVRAPVDAAARRQPSRRVDAGAGRRSAAPPSCWSCAWARPPTRRCA